MEIRRYTERDHEQVLRLHVLGLKQAGAHKGEGPWDDDLYGIEASYLNARGEFLIGEYEGQVIATGAIKPARDGLAEVKRMRVDPAFQRRGYARVLLERLEQTARALGYEGLLLETGEVQTAAQALYGSSGFAEVARETIDGLRCIRFEKKFVKLVRLGDDNIRYLSVLYDWKIAEPHNERFTCRPIEIPDDRSQYIEAMRRKFQMRDTRHFVLADAERDVPLGKVSLFNLNPRNRSGEFGYYMPEASRGRGLGGIMIRRFIDRAYSDESLNLYKIYATTSASNTPSIRMLERLHFHLDGRLRDHYWIEGALYDQLHYSLLRSEWRKAGERTTP